MSCVRALLVCSTIVLGGRGGSIARDTSSLVNGLWGNRSPGVVTNVASGISGVARVTPASMVAPHPSPGSGVSLCSDVDGGRPIAV